MEREVGGALAREKKIPFLQNREVMGGGGKGGGGARVVKKNILFLKNRIIAFRPRFFQI
jgi:hypothetical protein